MKQLYYCPKCKDSFTSYVYGEEGNYYVICPTCKIKIYIKI